MESVAENIAAVKAKMVKICTSAELIAVSKNHGVDKIREALAAGQMVFGENKVQEAKAKFPLLRAEFPKLKLHLIGPLQTNKVKDALEIFDVIQTVDREKLAREIAKYEVQKECFIQVNIGEEDQKAGIAPQTTDEFYRFCTQDLKMNITGLMCIPPLEEPAFMYFALLRNIAQKLGKNLKLSMGMSADYEEALELGADYIRVGSAIFGSRIS